MLAELGCEPGDLRFELYRSTFRVVAKSSAAAWQNEHEQSDERNEAASQACIGGGRHERSIKGRGHPAADRGHKIKHARKRQEQSNDQIKSGNPDIPGRTG